jgi:hypothetical protein
MRQRSAAEISEDSERMGDSVTIWLIFILLFNIDVYILLILHVVLHTNEKSMQ